MALQTELYVLNLAGLPQEEHRHYICKRQFPKFVIGVEALKSIPSFISTEDAIIKWLPFNKLLAWLLHQRNIKLRPIKLCNSFLVLAITTLQ